VGFFLLAAAAAVFLCLRSKRSRSSKRDRYRDSDSSGYVGHEMRTSVKYPDLDWHDKGDSELAGARLRESTID
jgi:hypothetical protein